MPFAEQQNSIIISSLQKLAAATPKGNHSRSTAVESATAD